MLERGESKNGERNRERRERGEIEAREESR